MVRSRVLGFCMAPIYAVILLPPRPFIFCLTNLAKERLKSFLLSSSSLGIPQKALSPLVTGPIGRVAQNLPEWAMTGLFES